MTTETPATFTVDPDVFHKTDAKGNPRTISERTQKDYTRQLNALAKSGWADRAALKKNSRAIIKYIKELHPDDTEAARHKKRYIIYSIMWAMDSKYLKTKNAYYKYLQEIPPITNVSTGGAWVPLKDYKKPETD
jgi:hypothetical protein